MADWPGTPVAQTVSPTGWPGTPVTKAASAPEPSWLDRALASPGARFAKGALVNTLTGTLQAIQSPLGHATMPFFDPVGAASDLAGLVAPKNAFTASQNQGRDRTNSAISAINRRVETARANVDPKDTGTDWYQGAGDVAGALIPLPGGKARLASDIAAHAPQLAGDAGKAAAFVSNLASRAGKTPEQIAATGADNAGRGMLGAEALGPTGIAHMAALGRRAGQTAEPLAGTLIARQQSMPDRLLSDFASQSGIDPRAALGHIDDVVKNGRATAQPLYRKAFAGGSTAPLLPSLQDAFNVASRNAREAENAVSSAETGATLSASRHLPSDNVYAANAAGEAERAATADINAKRAAADAAASERDHILETMRGAQADAANGVKGGMWSPRLAQFLGDPIIKQGINRGLEVQRLESLAAGERFNPMEYAVTGANEAGEPIVSRTPNARLLDTAKRGLDEIINDAKDPQTGRIAWNDRLRAVDGVRRSLLTEMDRLNPDYANARNAAGDYLSARTAFERGQNTILNPNVTAKQVQDLLGTFSTAERDSFKGGIANKLFNQAQNARLSALLVKTPLLRQKMVAALGEDAANTFIKNVGREGDLAQSANRMMPRTNSITSDVNNAVAEQDAGSNALNVASKFSSAGANLAHGKPLAAAISAIHAAGTAFPDFMKTRGMPVDVRDEVGRLLMSSPEDMARALKMLREHGVNAPADILGTLAPRAVGAGTAIYGQQ